MSIRMRPRIRDIAQHPERLGDQLVERDGDRPQLERPRLDTRHVEKLVTSRESRSVCFWMSSSSSARSWGIELDVGPAQARDRSLHGRQRRPQVVRSRTHERDAPAVDLFEQPRPQGLVARRALSTASAAWLAKVPSRLRSPASCASCRTRIPTGRLSSTRATEHGVGVSASTNPSDRVCPPETSEVSSADVRGVTHRGSHVQTLVPVLRTGLAVRQDQGSPPRGKGVLHRADDVGHQLVQGEVTDQGARQVVEAAGLFSPAKRLFPCGAQAGDHLSHDQHHGHVHHEGDPVLRVVHRQCLVRGEEEEVVGEEPRHRADRPGDRSRYDDPNERGQHEDEGRDGDAQVRAEREQDGEQHAKRRQGDDHAHNRAPVGCQPVLHGHCFPSDGLWPTSECTDEFSGPSQVRAQ